MRITPNSSAQSHVTQFLKYMDAHVSICKVMPENGGLKFAGESFRFSSAFIADFG